MASPPLMKAKLVGAETIVGDLNRYSDTIRARLVAAVQASSLELVQRAKALAPKRTGNLQGSIYWQGQVTEKRIIGNVGTDLHYGRFLESGWTPNPRKSTGWKRNPRTQKQWKAYAQARGGRKIFAHPFLKPALGPIRGTITQRLLEAVRGGA